MTSGAQPATFGSPFSGSPAKRWGSSATTAPTALPPAATADTPFPLPFWVIDAFAEKPFTGNPAAVVLLPAGGVFPDALWMAKA
jgi:hypothetical protein